MRAGLGQVYVMVSLQMPRMTANKVNFKEMEDFAEERGTQYFFATGFQLLLGLGLSK